MPCQNFGKRGFTLVELAIVLVIVGLLMGLGIGMVGPLITMTKTRESRDMVAGAAEAVNSYASGNNKLPDLTGFAAIVRSSNDAWSRPLLYVFDSQLNTPASKDTICGRKSTFISLTDSTTGATISNVAYLVLSQGEDAVTNTNIAGIALTSGPRAAATAITADTANDLVHWVTQDELRTKVGCQGAQLKILNNELPYGTVASPYPAAGTNILISVDGGATPGTLRWCVEAPSLTPLPLGIAFAPLLTGAIQVAPNTCNGLPEANWISSPTLTISGTPLAASQGSYTFTLYVRDNDNPNPTGTNDNITSKSFVLTINP